ncbi:hypothetical protein [Bilophila wadsworthia]|nr:hypothetical protein [Bilophila wadsworthia]
MHVATGRVKRMSAGFASTWGATPATHTKQPTFATCTISVLLHAGYATTLKQIYRGNEPMTAQEWLDELERLREAATPGPWKHDKWIIKSLEARKIAQTINLDNSAYIVAACNAVPMLVEMLRIAVSLIEAQNAQRARKGERIPDIDVMRLLFTMTEPKE